MSSQSASGYLRGWPPIEERTHREWEAIARRVIAESRVPDGDLEALTLALESSAARERSIREEYLHGWSEIEEEAHIMNGENE